MALYDPEALASYIATQQGAGLVPEFTNIPGAAGFQVGPLAEPEPDPEMDFDFELPDLDQLRTQEEARQVLAEAQTQIELRNQAEKESLELELDLPDRRFKAENWQRMGLQELATDKLKGIAFDEAQITKKLASPQYKAQAQKDKEYLRNLTVKMANLGSEAQQVRTRNQQDAKDETQISNAHRAAEIQERKAAIAKAEMARMDAIGVNAETLGRYEELQIQAQQHSQNQLEIEAVALELTDNLREREGLRDQEADPLSRIRSRQQQQLKDKIKSLETRGKELVTTLATSSEFKIQAAETGLLASYGIHPDDGERVAKGLGQDLSPLAMKKLAADTSKVLGRERQEDRRIHAKDIATLYPGHIPFFIEELKDEYGAKEGEDIGSEVRTLQQDIRKVKLKINPRLLNKEGTKRLTAKELLVLNIRPEDAKALEEEAVMDAQVDAIIGFESRFKKKRLGISGTRLADIETLTEQEEAILADPELRVWIVNLIDNYPEMNAEMRQQYAELVARVTQKLSPPPAAPVRGLVLPNIRKVGGSSFLRSIFKKLVSVAVTDFNAQYSNTIGITATDADFPLLGLL